MYRLKWMAQPLSVLDLMALIPFYLEICFEFMYVLVLLLYIAMVCIDTQLPHATTGSSLRTRAL